MHKLQYNSLGYNPIYCFLYLCVTHLVVLTHLVAPVILPTSDPYLTSGGRRCVHYDSVAALRVLLQMLSELLKLEVGGVGQDTYVVALTFF